MKESQENQTEVNVKQSSELSSSKSKENNQASLMQFDGVPMIAVKTEQGYVVACGKYRREKIYETAKEAEKACKKVDWENIACYMNAVRENIIETIKNNK